MDKEQGRAQVASLVEKFSTNASGHLDPSYGEYQVRTDFITPLLHAFGWDVYNDKQHSPGLREVMEEAFVAVSEEKASKRPDYELRLARQRKLFVEAKKPSVQIDRAKAPAFQARRYGYSASLPIVVLTNFHQLAIYDCVQKPSHDDEAHHSRILLVGYQDFLARFDDLWDFFARDTVYSGVFDERFRVDVSRRGAQQFDDFFLGQVRRWRELLAIDINANCPSLTPTELSYFVQRFLSRLVFLRICEDRDIEKYEALRELSSGATFDALMEMLQRADEFYDSGLFHLLDEQRLGIRLSDYTLQTIISELYYPHSPYTFAVVETEMLGEIYEQFLGEEISIQAGAVVITEKPEVRESGGVVPTPRYIVDSIVERTLHPLIRGRSPEDLRSFTVADPCCGSGVFLLAAFEMLAEHYLEWYVADGVDKHRGRSIVQASGDRWSLTFEERRQILIRHIRGVDIDSNAVEVAKFSLFLKLIEGESKPALQEFFKTSGTPVLPTLDNCLKSGNSLVNAREWMRATGPMPQGLIERVMPFDWRAEFEEDFQAGGFSAVIENPPYVRIQNMITYYPEEVRYYQNAASPYATARQDNFDKYALFLERSLSLLKPGGRIGAIIPNKFMTIQSGRALRSLLAEARVIESIVNFGAKKVFGKAISNYTCLLILERSERQAPVSLERVTSLEAWRYGAPGQVTSIEHENFSGAAWRFTDPLTQRVFTRMQSSYPSKLGSVAEIFVGVQTSKDEIYILHPTRETEDYVFVTRQGQEWRIEKGILRPSLYKVSIVPYQRPTANAWMIFPYDIATNANGKKVAHLLQPEDFSARFPGCFAYLQAHQAELESRKTTGGLNDERQWYQFGRSQSITKFDSPKIILPALSTGARYAFDDSNIVVTGGGNGPYYLLRPNDEEEVPILYLLALLHHPAIEAFIRISPTTFGGGYYGHGKQFLSGIPVPLGNPGRIRQICESVRDLVTAQDAVLSARTEPTRATRKRLVDILRKSIEDLVSLQLELSEDDVELMAAVPIPE